MKTFLVHWHKLYEVPVFYDSDPDGFRILSDPALKNVKTVITKSTLYTRKKSRYNNDPILNNERIDQPKRLKGVDTQRKQELETKLSEYVIYIDCEFCGAYWFMQIGIDNEWKSYSGGRMRPMTS